jgi:hypothetical protein
MFLFILPLKWTSTIPACADEKPVNTSTQFAEQLIKDQLSYSYGLDAADLDGDGDVDIAGCDTRNFKLYWFENSGHGSFREHLIEDGDHLGIFGHITGNAIKNATPGDAVYIRWFQTPRLERLKIGDINSDGKLDVVVVENLHGDIYCYLNSDRPSRDVIWPRLTLTRHTIPGAYDVEIVDIDADGDLDVAVSTWRLSNKFVWLENPGAPWTAEDWPLHVIEANIAEPRTIRFADFNSDGRPDLLGTALTANQVVWYENSGDPRKAPWTRHVIDAQTIAPAHGMPADIDGDGDQDVVMALGLGAKVDTSGTHEIVWYENTDSSKSHEPWSKHVIAGNFDQAFEAIAVDLDGDGKLDVAATSYSSPHGGLVWFQNPGSKQQTWTMHPLKADWPGANQVIAADLDQDGKPDLVAGTSSGIAEIRWWRNTLPSPRGTQAPKRN